MAAGAVALVAAAGVARADGAVPFYGYSGYFGAPTTYYTQSPDVHQSTSFGADPDGFDVRTYTTGGPFWGYRSYEHRRRPARREREVIRSKG